MDAKAYFGRLNTLLSIGNVIAGRYRVLCDSYDSFYGETSWANNFYFRIAHLEDNWVEEFIITEFKEYDRTEKGMRLYLLVMLPTITVYHSNSRFVYSIQNNELKEDDTSEEQIDMWLANIV